MKRSKNFYEPTKRLLDLIGATVGLIICSPILLLVALYIKLVSPGPVFADIPKRAGRGGKLFRMYKFRSMIPNAHEYLLKHPKLYEKYRKNNYKLPPDEDPRFIPGAKFLRKSSLDELPEVVNILKGEMSLVGPRAYYPFELEEQRKRYPKEAHLIDQVLAVKPGLTGLWQVSGRSQISFPERIALDANYARRRSVLFDLWLLLKTPWAVISCRGAE